MPDSGSIFQHLGAMFGHIAAGIFADPKNPPARLYGHAGTNQPNTPEPPSNHAPNLAPPPPGNIVVSQQTQEAVVMTATGPVMLRRTVIDEIAPAPHHSGQGPSAGGGRAS